MLELHDGLHPHDGDPAWFEAFWFAFIVPEIELTVYVYPWFRAAMGLWGGGVLAWDGKGQTAWTMLHNDYRWAEPLGDPDGLAAGDTLNLPQGVRIDCLKPGTEFRVRYEHPALALDVTFAGAREINVNTREVGTSKLYAGHIDQPGHYTGRVRVGEHWHDVDCHWIRDRSWGPRRNDNFGMHVGYYHASADADNAFLVVTDSSAAHDRSTLITGYLVRDSVQAALTTGNAAIERLADGSPASCIITATDALGREVRATGESLTKFAYQLQPGMFNWSSLARWQFGGLTAHGELQDTWHPDKYRQFIRNEWGT
jgi:hypothetical protein